MHDQDISEDISVWIVDDHREFRDTIRDLITDEHGMRCPHTFASCEAFLDELPSLTLPDIILMDLSFPGQMSGIKCMRAVRSLSIEVRFVILTMQLEDDVIFEAIQAGASGYLYKMSDPEKIVHAIKEVAHHGSMLFPPRIALRILDTFRRSPPISSELNLSKREKEILELLTQGTSQSQLAERLLVGKAAIDTHVQRIYEKLRKG